MRTFVLSLIILTILSCTEEKSPLSPNLSKSVLIPLKLGNEWTYSEKIWNSSTIKDITWKVNDTLFVNDSKYYLIKQSDFEATFIATNLDSGLFFAVSDTNTIFEHPIFYKYPAEDGEIYNYKIPQTDSILTLEVRIENISTQNQSYECYGYILHNINFQEPIMSFCPNIGMVRRKMVYVTTSGVDTSKYFLYELKSYQIQ